MTRIGGLSRSRIYLGIFLVVVAFYWKLTLTRQFDWIWGPDLAGQVLPWFETQARAWQHGSLPLWDPYQWAGQPLLGQTQPGTAYPLNWILFALPLKQGHIAMAALQWYFVVIHFMAAVFAYWLCRELGQSRLAGLAGGLIFSLGGYVGGTNWPQMLNGALWFPLILLFLLRAARAPNTWGNAALSGMFLGISFLSGHHQIPILACVALGGAWLFVIFRSGRLNWRLAGAAALSFAIAGLTAALQILPAVEYGRLAKRWVGGPQPLSWAEAVPYYIHEQFQLRASSLLGLVIPSIRAQYQMFIGVAALALAGIGLAVYWRDARARIIAFIGAFGLFYAVGTYTGFQGLLYSITPWIDKARGPSAAVFFLDAAAAILAGYGLDHLASSELSVWPRRAMWAVLSFGVFSLGVSEVLFVANKMAFPVDDQFVFTAVFCLIVAGLLYGRVRGTLSPAQGRALITVALVLELSGPTGYVIVNRTTGGQAQTPDRIRGNEDIARFVKSRPGFERAEVIGDALEGNWGGLHGVEMWGGYLASVTSNLLSIDYPAEVTRKLWGVSYVIAKEPPAGLGAPVYIGASGLGVYQRPGAFPRAWAVHRVVTVADINQGRRMTSGDLPSMRDTAYMLKPAPEVTQCGQPDDVALLWHDSDEVRIRADMACKGMVILSDTFYPGWRARVDGQRAPILDVNGAMRGVVVPEGKHYVTMRYRPASVMTGAAATLLGVILSLAIYGLGRRRTRTAKSGD